MQQGKQLPFLSFESLSQESFGQICAENHFDLLELVEGRQRAVGHRAQVLLHEWISATMDIGTVVEHLPITAATPATARMAITYANVGGVRVLCLVEIITGVGADISTIYFSFLFFRLIDARSALQSSLSRTGLAISITRSDIVFIISTIIIIIIIFNLILLIITVFIVIIVIHDPCEQGWCWWHKKSHSSEQFEHYTTNRPHVHGIRGLNHGHRQQGLRM